VGNILVREDTKESEKVSEPTASITRVRNSIS